MKFTKIYVLKRIQNFLNKILNKVFLQTELTLPFHLQTFNYEKTAITIGVK